MCVTSVYKDLDVAKLALRQPLHDTPGVTKGQEPRDYRLTIRIPTSLHQAIKRTSVEDKRSVSDWIVVTLQAAIAEREERAKREQERTERPKRR